MEKNTAGNLILKAKQEPLVREKLIADARPFILRTAGGFCRKHLEWGRDEELSIALEAFNEAIDNYVEHRGSFEGFARVVIRRRLVDYFRRVKEGREAPPVLLEDVPVEEDFERQEREQEILLYRERLQGLGLDFDIVAGKSPKHRKTREELHKAARALASRRDLMGSIAGKGILPRKELSLLTGISTRVLERGRAYILALALLLGEEDFPHLKEYVVVLTEKGGKTNES